MSVQWSARDEPALLTGVSAEALADAVSASRSWRGVLRTLGLTSACHGRTLRAECDRLGIDYDHFRTRRWTDDVLLAALADARSWPELLAGLGYFRDSGSARATVRKHAFRLGAGCDHLNPRPLPAITDPFARPADIAHLRAAGAYLVAGACAMLGFKVSWPLEPAVYDLLIDADGALHRVQVKTTSRQRGGAWECKITHRRGRETSWYTKDDIDYFGVVDGDRTDYMIPVSVVDGIGTIVLRRYAAYRVPEVAPTPPAASDELPSRTG